MTLTMTPAAMVEEYWQELLDRDDRTSPADYPDMVLISREELTAAVELYKTHMLPAQRDVLIERERQLQDEGFEPAGDDLYTDFQLGKAAAAYLGHAIIKDATRKAKAKSNLPPGVWPWRCWWWKPTDRRRDLVKAAALIIAEIERLDRAAAPASETGPAGA